MERLHHRVEHRRVRVGTVEVLADFVVHPRDHGGRQQILDDRGAVALDGGMDGLRVRGRIEALE